MTALDVLLGEATIQNFMQAIVTDTARVNADFHYKAGLNPKIVRKASHGCCKWCTQQAGTYNYEDVYESGNDVYRRHKGCKCTVEYDPGTGKVQNVHSKTYRELGTKEKIEKRKTIGLDEVSADVLEERKYIGLSANSDGDNLIEEHKEPKFLKTIDINDTAVIKREIEEFEKSAVNERIETALVITKNGKVYKCYGLSDSVYPDSDLGDEIIGATISHNHPITKTEYSFSNADLSLFENYKLESLRGCDEKYTYELTRIASEIDDEVKDWQSEENFQHSAIRNTAYERGYGYRRHKND